MNDSIIGRSREVQDESRQSILKFLKAFSIPLILLTGYFLVRFLNFQPSIEMNGLSDLIRVLFLMFGVSTAYFMYLIQLYSSFDTNPTLQTNFWMLSSVFLLLILFDDLLMLHEQFGAALDVSDKVLLIANGVLLGAILLYYRNRLVRPFWVFIGLFGILSVAAILLDNTGTYWHVGGKEIDLEQILEVFALLGLSSAYASQALFEFRQIVENECRLIANP